MIELSIILTISVVLNIFFFFLSKVVVEKLYFLSENIQNLLETVETFSNHLGAVHELEMFYGDDTLQNLLSHSKQVVNEIKMYKDIYTLTSDEEELGDMFNDTEDEEGTEEEE